MDYNSIIGRVYDIQGFSIHDGPGIRTTVFLKGCPLSCLWCHSPEGMKYDYELMWYNMKCIGIEKCGLCINACKKGALTAGTPEKSILDGTEITKIHVDRTKCNNCLDCTRICPANALVPSGYEISVEEAYQRVSKDREFYKDDGGVTISGGEPMAQFEFTYYLAKRCKEENITVCVDTTGYADGYLYEKLMPYVDMFLYDLKNMDPKKSKMTTGVSNEIIIENAKRIARAGGKLQIRIPMIPKLNTDEENLRKCAEFCCELGSAVKIVQLLPYHKMGLSKYERLGLQYKLKNVEPPTDDFMKQSLEFMLSYGLPAQIN